MDNSAEDLWSQLTGTYCDFGRTLSRVETKYQYAKNRCRVLEEENRKQEDQLADLRIEMFQLRHNSKQEEHDKQIEILNTRIAKIYLELSTERKYWQTKYRIPCSTNNVSGEHEISSNLSYNHFETSHDILQDPPKHETMASASSAHLVPRLSNEQEFPILTTGGHSLGTLQRGTGMLWNKMKDKLQESVRSTAKLSDNFFVRDEVEGEGLGQRVTNRRDHRTNTPGEM